MNGSGAETDAPLGIICGAGSIPIAVANAAHRRGRKVVLFALRGWADAEAVAAFPHYWFAVGQFGRFCRTARREGCRDIVMVGSLVRPAISQIRFDWGTLVEIPGIVRGYRGGDDHMLTVFARIFERQGFRLMGAHEVAPEITARAGAMGRCSPDPQTNDDIEFGFALLSATSPFDVGQAAVVAGRRVLGIEGPEGTDGLIERIAELRRTGRISLPHRTGVLVKAPKRGQDRRFDLPSIGPATISRVADAGIGGIVVLAGGTIVAEPQKVVEIADRHGVFVVGRPAADGAS